MTHALLVSPMTGALLQPDGPDLLRDVDGRRWPVVDGIPYLRTGRDALVEDVADRLAAGDRDEALVLLLADADDWWRGPSPDPAALRRLVRDRATLTLRDAMAVLAFGRVGDYFAHRWSDPTFLAGLALLEAHWRPATRAFELACGIGHYARELARRGVAVTGADVVFAKLWLARHWVVPPDTRLLCFDAAAPWPLRGERFDLVFCHDAFYFLEPKAAILARLRALATPGGRVALGHIHNSAAAALSSGHAVSADDVEALFPRAAVYDDAELTRAHAEKRRHVPCAPRAIGAAEAFAIEDRPDGEPSHLLSGGLALPPADAALRLNPLYRDTGEGWAVAWPSPRYEAEYAGLATYPPRLGPDIDLAVPSPEAIRRRIVVDLPERW